MIMCFTPKKCCKNSCRGSLNYSDHCWHPTHHGPWYGTIPPANRCCWCGVLDTQLHGPYKPESYQWTWVNFTITENMKFNLNDSTGT